VNKASFPLGAILRAERNFYLSFLTSSTREITRQRQGFPLGEIFRPNRNFSLFHELSSKTNCKKTKRNFVSVEKFRLVESGLNESDVTGKIGISNFGGKFFV
jgi:hypothetical protein